jgi:hypothetical protein
MSRIVDTFLGFGFLFTLLGLGCGDPSEIDEAALARCAEPSQVLQLGTGDSEYLPVTAGQDLSFTAGFQGGWHVWGAFRVGNVNPVRTLLDFELIQDGEKIGGLVLPVTLHCGQVGYEYSGVPVELHFHRQPDQVADREMLMRLTLTEANGAVHTDSFSFIPRCCDSFE